MRILVVAMASLVLVQCSSSEPQENFTCSGKKVCAEMTSCSEANFYLKSCGVISLDGDSDGIPCEREVCEP